MLQERIKVGTFLIDEPMKNHTSFKIGGPVPLMIIPGNIDEVSAAIRICNENNLKYIVIGNGSNLLVSDKGIPCVVIKISEYLNKVKVEGNKIVAQAGVLLSRVANIALNNSLTGLEFASGIPGSLGGAVAMNAGAYGPEMKDVVTKIKCIDTTGNMLEFSNEEMNFGYRQSRVQKEDLIAVEIEMQLNAGNYEDIKSYMDELTEKRTSKQPLHLPSAGSTFRRPEGYFAIILINVNTTFCWKET